MDCCWVDFVEQVATLLDPVGSPEEDEDTVNSSVEDVDFMVFRRCGVFEGRRNGMMVGPEAKAGDRR